MMHLSFSLMVLALATRSAQVPPPANLARPVTSLAAACELPLAPYAGPLRTVTAKIWSIEARFLFDTGGGGTVLSTATARALGLEPFGRSTGFRHDGERVDGTRAGPVELALGAFTRRRSEERRVG